VPKDPPLSLYEAIRGKRTRDIELPNRSGTVDDRLIGTARGTKSKARDILRSVPQPGRSLRGRR
jgi:hypothetical protein